MIELTEIVYRIPEKSFLLDEEKVVRTNANYDNWHPGVSLVHFFQSPLVKTLKEEQDKVRDIFEKYQLQHSWKPYDCDQLHFTVIQLVGQHDEPRTDQRTLTDEELTTRPDGKKFDLNRTAQLVESIQPFYVQIGKGKLSEEGNDKTLRLTDSGQVVLKGHATDPSLMSKIREKFENEADIRHLYGSGDYQIYSVLGFVSGAKQLNQHPALLKELHAHCSKRSKELDLCTRINTCAIALFKKRTLAKNVTMRWNVYLGKKNPDIENLVEKVKRASEEIFKLTWIASTHTR